MNTIKKIGWWLFYLFLISLFLVIGIQIINSTLNKSSGSREITHAISKTHQVATFAGGCFWCMEPPFEKLHGVKEVISGYTGGRIPNPSYEKVASHTTGHVEAVQVIYDPTKISYQQLLKVYWQQIDPTDPDEQFVDRGESYLTVIFYHNDMQRKQAIASKDQLDQSGRFTKPIVTQIKPAQTFYLAEEYHQNYYQKNTIKYRFYRQRSGRDQFLNQIWDDLPS